MSVSWQNVEIPFGEGLDTRTDEKLVRSPKLVDLQNGVFTEVGGIKKRKGYTKITNTVDGHLDLGETAVVIDDVEYASNLDDALLKAVTTREDSELIGLSNNHLYSYNGVDRWTRRGRLTAAKITERTDNYRYTNATYPSTAVVDDTRVTAWYDSEEATVQFSVSSETAGTVYTDATTISGASNPICVGLEHTVHIYYYNSATTSIEVKVIQTGDILDSLTNSPLQLVSDCSSGVYDAIVSGYDGKSGIIVYKQTTTDDLVGFYVAPGGAVHNAATSADPYMHSPNTLEGSVNADSVALSMTGRWLWVSAQLSGGGLLKLGLFDRNLDMWYPLTSLVGVGYNRITIQAVPFIGDQDNAQFYQTQCVVWAQKNRVVNYTTVSYDSGLDALVGDITDNTLQNTNLASKGFFANGMAHALVVNRGHSDTVLQNTVFAVSSDGHIWGKLLEGISIGYETISSLPNVTNINYIEHVGEYSQSSKLTCALIFRRRLKTSVDASDSDRADFFANQGIKTCILDFETNERFQFSQVGKTLYINSGILHQYDGVRVHEAGFLVYPELSDIDFPAAGYSLAPSTGAGTLDLLGQYTYRVYYEHTNALGERVISTTARPISDTLVGTENTFTLTLPHLNITNRPDNSVSVVVFRGEGDADLTAGAPLYRVSKLDPSTSGTSNGYIKSTKTTSTENFTDEYSDLTILNNQLDYLNTSELDNTSPPSCSITTYGKDRLFCAGFEDGNEIRFSKLRFPAEGLAFSDALTTQVPDAGGPITAIDVLNQFLVVFKKDRIYVISGDGPDNFGNGSFSQAELVTTDVGCNSLKSVVRTPLGLMFSSDKGIFLISGNLQTTYIGADVEAYNGSTFVSATLLNDVNQVRFLVDSGRTLVFDYSVGQWTTFINHEGLDATVWDETYTYLRTNGYDVYLESGALFTDSGAQYSLRIRTPWLVLGSAQNYQRTRRLFLLGDFFSPHSLRCKIRYDYEGHSTEATWDPSSVVTATEYGDDAYGDGVYGGDGSRVYQVRFALPRQKCEAVSFEFYDSITNEIPGQSYQVSSLTLEAGIKKGPVKLGTGRTTGS